jgi:hypothetical protein
MKPIARPRTKPVTQYPSPIFLTAAGWVAPAADPELQRKIDDYLACGCVSGVSK